MLLRRARLLVLAVVGATLVVHCGFPDPVVLDAENGGATDSAVDETGSADGGADALADVEIADALPVEDVLVREDASVPRPDSGPDGSVVVGCEATSPTGDPCDCDGDGVKNGGPSCAPPPGKKADCDDFDKLVFPDQLSFVAAAWDNASPVPKPFDWNCDGNVQKQFPINVPCALANCGTEGFEGDPACGQPGKYIFCTKQVLPIGLVCNVTKTETRIQGCR